MRIFINEQACEAAEGSDALSAVREYDPELAGQVERGQAYITDGRAIPLASGEPVSPGTILRVIVAARRRGDPPHADA